MARAAASERRNLGGYTLGVVVVEMIKSKLPLCVCGGACAFSFLFPASEHEVTRQARLVERGGGERAAAARPIIIISIIKIIIVIRIIGARWWA